MEIRNFEQTPLTPGIYRGVPADLYHGVLTSTPSISSSMLREMTRECPAYAFARSYLNPDRPASDDKKAFDLGTAAHLIYLEPHRFNDAVTIVDADSWRTKDAQAARDEARAAGKVPLLIADAKMLEAMRASLFAHPIASQAFLAGEAELTFVWQDKETGLTCKCRPDFTAASFTHLVDFKTSTTANPADFGRKAFGFGYHQQAAWYIDGVEAATGGRPSDFWFVTQDKSYPFLTTVSAFPADAIEAGRRLNCLALQKWADGLSSGTWPSYRRAETPNRDTAFIIPLPKFAEYEIANILAAD